MLTDSTDQVRPAFSERSRAVLRPCMLGVPPPQASHHSDPAAVNVSGPAVQVNPRLTGAAKADQCAPPSVVLASVDAFPVVSEIQELCTGVRVTGRARIQVPPGSRIRSTTGTHSVFEAAGQDSAHSQPPALATETAGAASRWAVQVAPRSRVWSRRSVDELNIQMAPAVLGNRQPDRLPPSDDSP